MFGPPSHPFRRWMRHVASVPKGFVRYYVLKLLKEKPMSGSEIMEEIERETGGRWKPSLGSAYPLLAWLQDNSYIRELPDKESGIKRYILTDQGVKFLEEHEKLRETLQKKLELLAPPFLGGFWFGVPHGKLWEIREPARRFTRALLDLRMTIEENLTEQTLKEIGDFLNNAAEKIEELNKKLKEKKRK